MAISKYSPVSNKLVELSTIGFSTIAAFFPKCAFCWTAYASIFSSFGISAVLISEFIWIYPLLGLMMLFNLYSLYKVARERQSYSSLYMNAGGISLLLFQRYVWAEPTLTYLGLAMIFIGVWRNYVSGNLSCKIPVRKNLLIR